MISVLEVAKEVKHAVEKKHRSIIFITISCRHVLRLANALIEMVPELERFAELEERLYGRSPARTLLDRFDESNGK